MNELITMTKMELSQRIKDLMEELEKINAKAELHSLKTRKFTNILFMFSGINIITLTIAKNGFPIFVYFNISSIIMSSVFVIILMFHVFFIRKCTKRIIQIEGEVNKAVDDFAKWKKMLDIE